MLLVSAIASDETGDMARRRKAAGAARLSFILLREKVFGSLVSIEWSFWMQTTGADVL